MYCWSWMVHTTLWISCTLFCKDIMFQAFLQRLSEWKLQSKILIFCPKSTEVNGPELWKITNKLFCAPFYFKLRLLHHWAQRNVICGSGESETYYCLKNRGHWMYSWLSRNISGHTDALFAELLTADCVTLAVSFFAGGADSWDPSSHGEDANVNTCALSCPPQKQYHSRAQPLLCFFPKCFT